MRKSWFLGGSAVLFSADQMLKGYAEQNIEKGQEKMLTERIALRRVYNKGMCMNLLDRWPEAVRVLSLAAASALTGLQVFYLFRKGNFWMKKGLSLASAGAWSNTYDRWFRGYVVDYIGVKSRSGKLSAVTYNLGDFFIAAGGLIILLTSLLSGKKSSKEKIQ